MTTITSAFQSASHYQPQHFVQLGALRLPGVFAGVVQEYQQARESGALFDRSDRSLLIVSGADRQSWLHNMITNVVATLDKGAGNYAFAADVRGRTLFDMNVYNVGDALWVDLPARAFESAYEHFDHHLLMEDATLQDARGQFAQLGVTGPAAGDVAGRLGVTNFAALPDLAIVSATDESWLVRHDFAGLPGFELIVPGDRAAEWWDRLMETDVLQPAGYRALDILRVEAGIPWFGRDIDEQVIPPETGQIERGISYHKGCYLGQEVIERMRAYGSLARRLVRLTSDAIEAPPNEQQLDVIPLPKKLTHESKDAGRLTSLVRHPLEDKSVGLGYVKTRLSDVRELGVDGCDVTIRIA